MRAKVHKLGSRLMSKSQCCDCMMNTLPLGIYFVAMFCPQPRRRLPYKVFVSNLKYQRLLCSGHKIKNYLPAFPLKRDQSDPLQYSADSHKIELNNIKSRRRRKKKKKKEEEEEEEEQQLEKKQSKYTNEVPRSLKKNFLKEVGQRGKPCVLLTVVLVMREKKNL